MVITKTYSQGVPSPIATYDYEDIAEGTGIKIFYPFISIITGGTPGFHLGTSTIFSADIERSLANGSSYDFDLSPFNLPKTIRGTGYARFSAKMIDSSSFVVTIYRMRGADATQIATNTTSTWTSATLVNFVLPMAMTETPFKRGDFLRVNITATTSVGNVILGTDPANRDGANVTPAATYPTQFAVYIPFRIDL